MLTDSLDAVLERHLEPVRPADLALWMLRGLEILDPTLRPEVEGGGMLLYGSDRLLAGRPLPQPGPRGEGERAAALGSGLAALFDTAWRASTVLRRAGPDGMLRAGFEELFDHLDPYGRYLTPDEAAEARRRRLGDAAFGLRLVADRRGVLVSTVEPDSPAARAGLRPGDRLLAVEGTAVGADPAVAAALLAGPDGSEVALEVLRSGRPRTVLLRRTMLTPRTVQVERRDGIVWLTIAAFSTGTERAVEEALAAALVPTPPRGLVLDLRGNRGGVLTEAIATAALFLERGPVARAAGRVPEAERHYAAAGPDRAAGLPLVVLIDGRSASAAEVVAAALADRRRAAVVGSATLGKGLIQLVIPLPNGGELLVSWARLTAPLGWPIQGLGVLPALCTALSPEATTDGLGRLSRRDPPMGAVLARLRATRAPVAPSEVAALRGACPPVEGGDGDLAAARALIEQPVAWATAAGREAAVVPAPPRR